MKGLMVSVLKPAGFPDCTMGGVSSKSDNLILVGDDIVEIFEARPEMPAVYLVNREIGGKPFVHAEPVDNPTKRGFMAGGNFIYTSDSRFPSQYPISIHDRQE